LRDLKPYARRLVRRMLKAGIDRHRGYRYDVKIDREHNIVILLDKKLRKRYVLLSG